jgi:hypothetical protein
MRIAPVIALSPEQRMVLESQARSRSFPLRVVSGRASCCWRQKGSGTRTLLLP